jgi:multidrug resistance efflux pump
MSIGKVFPALFGAVLAGVLLGVLHHRGWSLQDAAATAQPLAAPREAFVAAPGRVEPVSEEIRLYFDIPGKIDSVLVEEGDSVARGQIVAVLQAKEYQDRLVEAEAAVRQRDAELSRLLNGSRPEEKREAKAQLDQAEAALNNARIEHERRQSLLRERVVSREEADRSRRDFLMAQGQYDAARERLLLARDSSRVEDIARARHGLAEAEARLEETRSLLGKTVIRSPIDGVVLRKHRNAGEFASQAFDTPIVTVGDVRVLRVRAEVDERDIAKIWVGQPAYVTADAYGTRRFKGRVVRIGKVLGRKNIRTDEPAERVDTKILETLVELDENVLVSGLRVDVFLLMDREADRRPAQPVPPAQPQGTGPGSGT